MQAAPSYTAVNARQTLQRPDPTPSPAKPQKVVWSSDVRQYVQRAFEPDNAIAGIDPTAMQEKLKVVITQAAETGQLQSINWATYPLPQDIILGIIKYLQENQTLWFILQNATDVIQI